MKRKEIIQLIDEKVDKKIYFNLRIIGYILLLKFYNIGFYIFLIHDMDYTNLQIYSFGILTVIINIILIFMFKELEREE